MNPAAMTVESGEPALLERLRRGDDDAFEALVRAQTPRLLATARRILGDEQDARDAVQDAFLSAFRALPTFAGQSRLSTWLHRIAVNAALMKLRQRRRKGERAIDDLLPRFLDDGHQAEPAVEWARPGDDALRRETCEQVRAAVAELPGTYREVLLMRDIEGLGTEETARLLGVTAGVVKTRLHRARQALRALLDPHFRAGLL